MQLSARGLSARKVPSAEPEKDMDTAPQRNAHGDLSNEGEISAHSVVVVSKEQISCDLLGEAVILNLKSGVYYGLDEIGARVWALIQSPKRVSEVRDIVLDEYDVEFDRCERDLLDLLTELRQRDLIETQG